MISGRAQKVLKRVAISAGVFVGVVLFSAFYATRVSNVALREQFPPPHVGTHFTLRPNEEIEGIPELGLSPGWIVAYATRERMFGDAFHVSPFGRILAHGTPVFVTEARNKDRQSIERFSKAFFEADARIRIDAPFSEAVAVLGPPHGMRTNDDGLIWAWYNYIPPGNSLIDWITNGFDLAISNGMVIHKAHSYMQRR